MARRSVIRFLLLGLLVFLLWRFIRPMNIFIVSDAFENTIATNDAPELLSSLHAEACGVCHQAFYQEWQTSIHSQAWTDPYFQTDWEFDNSQHICRNCHTPLDRQQPTIVRGYRDRDKWDPITEPNPDFDPDLQHEGVTCTACHLRDGKIVGVQGIQDAPHPVQQLNDPNEVCVRCHVVDGDRWDTRLPRGQPRSFTLSVPADSKQKPAAVEAIVRYHLLDERRRKRIGYENRDPIAYEVFRGRISLAGS